MSVLTAAEAPYRAPSFIDFKPEWSGKGATQARLDALRQAADLLDDERDAIAATA